MVRFSCRPREGCGLHLNIAYYVSKSLYVAVPARGADCIYDVECMDSVILSSCRPREGCGLHQQKDTNPYRHFDAILLIRALSIAQAPSEKQDFCKKATVFAFLFWIARRITPFFRGVF